MPHGSSRTWHWPTIRRTTSPASSSTCPANHLPPRRRVRPAGKQRRWRRDDNEEQAKANDSEVETANAPRCPGMTRRDDFVANLAKSGLVPPHDLAQAHALVDPEPDA